MTQPTKKEVAPKAMTATERKMVKEIIEGDFDRLKREIDMHCAELEQRKSVEFSAQWADLQQTCIEANREWNELKAALRARVDAFVDAKRAQGIRVHTRYSEGLISFGREISFTSVERENAQTEFDNNVKRARMMAHNALEQQRSQIQREIVLTGIVSGQAKDFIDKQPDPREVMVQALSSNPTLAGLFGVQVVEGQVERPAVEAEAQNGGNPVVEIVNGEDAVPHLNT